MKCIFICLVVLFFVAAGANARVVELTLHPTKAAEQSKRYRLLPKPEEQSDSDALPLYKKAIESLPNNLKTDQIREWVKAPLYKLPLKQVESTLQKLKPTLRLLEQAAKCKKCNWPAVKAFTLPENLGEYRTLAYILALQAHLKISQGRYEQAIDSIQIGLAMAKHLGKASLLVQGLVGVGIGSLMLNQVETLVQTPNAPNLYWALKSLPKPLIDLTKQIEQETAELKSDPRYKNNPTVLKAMQRQLQPAHESVRFMMKKLDRQLTMLQCVEALRLYAGAHDGKFPNKLTEITQVTIPSDPISKKPFIYRRTGSEAVLEGPSVEGIKPEDMISYELTLKE